MPVKISSRDNSRIKHARLVREGRVDDQIFIEGARLCEEALNAELKIFDIFITENFARSERQREFLKKAGKFNLIEAAEKIFDSLSDTKTSQGVIVIAEKPAHGKETIQANLKKMNFRWLFCFIR